MISMSHNQQPSSIRSISKSHKNNNNNKMTSSLARVSSLGLIIGSILLLIVATSRASPLGDPSSPSMASADHEQEQPTAQQTMINQQQQPPPLDSSSNSTNGPESDSTPTSQATNINSNNQQTNQNNNVQHQQQQTAQPIKAQQAMVAPSLPPKLPNINVFISKNEIRKLLGIDAKINYVTGGQINTYPFGFTIPLGYNQSDIIFTWQNLGPTNVNYSISLVIGNAEAVGPPLINITRIGLIPRHEQVFKITLPCSGKRTDEVDVQVLINISGLVPVESGDLMSGDQDGVGVGSAQDQLNADMQLASMTVARQQLATAQQMATGDINSTNNNNNSSSSIDGMQSDEAAQPQMRPVSHTLVIKRKKICTMHPVPIQPTPKVWPANQPTTRVPPVGPVVHSDHQTVAAAVISTPAPAQPSNKWQDVAASMANNNNKDLFRQVTGHRQQPVNNGAEPSAEPSHHPSLSPPALPIDLDHPVRRVQAPAPTRRPTPNELTSSPSATFTYPNWPTRGLPVAPVDNPLTPLLRQQPPPAQPASSPPLQVPTSSLANQQNNNPLMFTLIVMSLVISIALIVLLLLSSGSSSSSRKSRTLVDKLNALTSCLLRRAPACSRVHNSRGSKCSSSTSNSTSRSTSHHHHHETTHRPIKHNSSGGGGGLIGALRVPTIIGPSHKASPSSVSGLSTISGHSNLVNKQQQAYYFGTTTTTSKLTGPATANYATNGYYTIGNNGNQHHNSNNYNKQQHHYQHPPTADLLGTGYQCQQANTTTTTQQQQQPSATPHYPIHLINAGNGNGNGNGSQTTRLIWASNGQGQPDGFMAAAAAAAQLDSSAYMRLSNAARSDSGSVYQTIY